MESYLKISYITPVFNQVEFIEKTILSVLNQDYPNLEYIIIDGGSTDGTLDIIKKYECHLCKWISEPDNGMYDALNKGFKFSSGEIMGWINGDDILLPGAFFSMNRLFHDLPEINWIQGLNAYIDLDGNLINVQQPKKFSSVKFLRGDFKWIQQESTFWRRSLWNKAGEKISGSCRFAGDIELWFRFFQFSKLYNACIPIGAWRKREGQLSEAYMSDYLREVNIIIEAYHIPNDLRQRIRKIKMIEKMDFLLQKQNLFNIEFLNNKKNSLYQINRITIQFSYQENKFVI